MLTVAFLLVLVASMLSMTRLTHATSPPQLFRPGTNIEMFLDLMANYTTQGIPSLPSDYNPVCHCLVCLVNTHPLLFVVPSLSLCCLSSVVVNYLMLLVD